MRSNILNQENGKKFVCVVGAPRSGTTWIQSMLSQHPYVATTGESYLFSGYLGPWDRRFNHEKNRETPDLGLGILFTDSEMLQHYRSFAYSVIDRIGSRKPGATIILDKTPNHALNGELILRVVPDATFINVLRDPRAVVASLIAAGRGWGADWAPKGAYLATQEWLRYFKAGRDIQSLTPRYTEVSYESMHAQGPSELLRLFTFIGLEATKEECEVYCRQCSFDSQKRSNKTSSDGFYRRGKIDTWLDDLSRSEIRTIEYLVGDVMQKLDYTGKRRGSRRPPMRILLRNFLSKIETVTRYLEDRL